MCQVPSASHDDPFTSASIAAMNEEEAKARENLINALKLVANQQTDGDSPIQRIITGLHERTRKGIMDRQPQCSGRGSIAQGLKVVLCPEAEKR